MNELKDGAYTVGATLTGGSGRAKIESPTKLTVEGGEIRAEIRWNSPYYDYMEVEGREYRPVNEDGNSLFVIDAELDRDLAVRAETVAMSEPHTIDYTLRLDSKTLSRRGGALPLAAAVALMTVVVILLMRKRKKHEK